MCGIAGIWNGIDEAAVATMTRSVAHRGPDGLLWATRGNSSYGGSRLAIVGDPTAPALFCDAETGLVVLLNGEIYNVHNLRTQLAANGARFDTDLEAEVVAKLYAIHGLNFAKLLKGMFAIAILDSDRLVLARDRVGIKPLHYKRVGQKVVFGSEAKAILAHPEVVPELDPAALHEISAFGYVSSLDRTVFQGVYQVEPGTVMEFTQAGQSRLRYWQMPLSSYLEEGPQPDYDVAVSQLRQVMIESVDLLANHGSHRLGIYLSGGLDSTILTLIARGILGHPVTTFTLADSPDSADLLAAREVAGKLGTQHVERHVTLDDCLGKLSHFVEHYESLIAGGVFDIYGGLAFHLLSETVSQHVRVAFSGEGADELFGGYYWVYTHPLGFADRIRNRLHSLPNGDHVGKLVSAMFPYPEDEQLYRRNLFDALMGGGLANYHLQSVDRSAGAFGFEIRPAYLFDDIAEFALSLPIEYKVPDKRTTKRILRDAFRPDLERLGLDWVLTRQKEGMPAALRGLAPLITRTMEDAVEDSAFSEHPLRPFFSTRADKYLFDLFAEAFLPQADYALYHCHSQ